MNLAKSDAATMLAVKDLGRARHFYEDVLGLEKIDEGGEGVVTYRSGASTINVYRSEFAGTNKATAVTWDVDNIEDVIRELKSKGVAFEHYQVPGLRQEGDLYVAENGAMRTAWFKDPDGNILSLYAD